MSADTRFQNIRVYCAYPRPLTMLVADERAHPGLAFIAYWGIVLFGYDT